MSFKGCHHGGELPEFGDCPDCELLNEAREERDEALAALAELIDGGTWLKDGHPSIANARRILAKHGGGNG